jgi:signal transduction histidine kinase/ActR/RegA family two-component response regulator
VRVKLVESVDWLLHDRVHADARDLFRARFVAFAGLVGVAVAMSTGGIAWWMGDRAGLVVLAYAVEILATLAALRAGLSPLAAFVVLEVLTAGQFVGCVALEDPLDWTMVMWLALFPVLSVLFAGLRQGLWGLFISGVAAAAMFVLRQHEWFERSPLPLSAVVARAAGFVIALFFIAAAFDALRAQALTRAEQAAAARTLFLANMSHELRTPMNGVIGITEILLSSPQPEDTRRQLELLKRSGTQLVTLVNDILDLTRLETGRVSIESVPTDVAGIVTDVVSLMAPLATEKRISLTQEVAGDVPAGVLTDPTRLRQAVTNLLANAVKFTGEGGVTVRVRMSGKRFRVEVEDTGIGMSPDVQQRLFKPFEQADASFTRRYGGSGLGLAISQRLVTAMGGFLDVRSIEGRGSTLALEVPCFPCARPEPEREPAPEPAIPGTDALQRRVLVVEDNAVNRHVVLALLAKCGCTCTVAEDGAQAVDAVLREPFDLVLMDCHMPNLDGFEATRRIRGSDGAAARLPIVALTASALNEDLARCREAGMDEVLTKPLTLAALRALLERVLSARAA